tara:strand:- start:1320 stop:1766 length:447 start_codon:yes stop_codon:yes gene_type:complete
MKKIFLTGAMAICTLFASAQFMVVTTVTEAEQDENGESASFSASQLTDKLGIGYQLNDAFTAGVQSGPKDSIGDRTWEIFVRYAFSGGVWATVMMPTEDASENMSLGLGYSFNVWNSLWIEPSYTMPANKPEEGEREGKLNLSLGYRF